MANADEKHVDPAETSLQMASRSAHMSLQEASGFSHHELSMAITL